MRVSIGPYSTNYAIASRFTDLHRRMVEIYRFTETDEICRRRKANKEGGGGGAAVGA